MIETDDKRAARLEREGKRDDGKLTDAEKGVEACANHIWLNAFRCINPSDEFLREVGAQVVRILNESSIVDGFIGRSPVAYIRVNKS